MSLFEVTRIKKLKLKNKIVMPPMCLYQAKNDGNANFFHQIHYAARALSGVGLIIVEATAVEARGRISNFDLGLWDNSQIKSHKKLVKQCQKFGAKVAVQLAHAGRKSQCNDSKNVGASPIAFSKDYEIPKQLNEKEIQKIKKAFIKATLRAEDANYDAIEIHAAHGYLINSFLSPITNQRDDKYGKSFENRTRLLKEILKEIKKVTKLAIILRISATEWQSNGWNIDDSISLAKEIEPLIDALHVSSGGNLENPDTPPKLEPLYQADFAKALKQNLSIPVIAVGLITTAKEGKKLLDEGYCDLVAYGRELLRNPNFPQYAAKDLNEIKALEQSYKRAFLG